MLCIKYLFDSCFGKKNITKEVRTFLNVTGVDGEDRAINLLE